MFYLIPTKKGLGVQLWGTYDDLRTIYSVVGNFWNDEDSLVEPSYENRNKLISGFSYEIRKAHEGSRLKKENSHFSFEKVEHLGCEIDWVHFLFSISALRHNARVQETNKIEIAIFLQLEYWLEKAMIEYDEKGGAELKNYIFGAINSSNKNLYQYMRFIGAEYFRLGGGKRAFRKLPNLLRRAVYFTDEYKEYDRILKAEAKRLNCNTYDLEVNDDDIDYENITW
jgi:hypothetical protein